MPSPAGASWSSGGPTHPDRRGAGAAAQAPGSAAPMAGEQRGESRVLRLLLSVQIGRRSAW